MVGIDPSLTGHAMALIIDGKLLDYRGWTDVKKLQAAEANREHLCWWKMPSDKEHKGVNRQHRISFLSSWTATMIGTWKSVVELYEQNDGNERELHVAIEDYAFSKRSTGLSDIHELCGVIKTSLWFAGTPFRLYDPMSIKMAWTGDGHADKDMMVAAAGRIHDVDLLSYKAAGENLADAILIASLLEEELSVREGYREMKDVRSKIRAVLLRTTKASPVALVSKPFVHFASVECPEPIASVAGL